MSSVKLPLLASLREAVGSLVETGVLKHPHELLSVVLPAVWTYGLTTGAALGIGAGRFGERAALTDRFGTLTYAALNQGTDRLASALLREGTLRPGTRVALLCGNDRGFVLSVGAAAKAGADVVLIGPSTGAADLGQVIEDERVDLVIHDLERVAVVAASGWRGSVLSTADLLGLLHSVPTGSRPPRPPRSSQLVVLTSGTTGRPRGVRRGRPGVEQILPALALLAGTGLRLGATTLVLPPLFHGYGFSILVAGLALGAPLVLPHEAGNGDEALDLVERHSCEVVVGVPTQLRRLAAATRGRRGVVLTSQLRAVVSGAAHLDAGLVVELTGLFGPVVRNFYGTSETGTATCAGPEALARDPRTVGLPVGGVRVEVRDEQGRLVPRGVIGQVHITSALGFSGYSGGVPGREGDHRVSRSGKTSAGSVPKGRNRRSGATAGVPTGDLGYIDAAGRLYVHGRIDDMVVCGGENVHPAQIEELLLAQPEVQDARVRPVPDIDFGTRLVAEIVAVPGGSPDPRALRELVRRDLGPHKVPREIVIVVEIALNAVGKMV